MKGTTRSYRMKVLASIPVLLFAVNAWADCPVSVSVGSRDALGFMDVTVSTAGSCGGSTVSVHVDDQPANGTFKCDKPNTPRGVPH